MAKNGIALSELFKVDSDEEQHQEPRNGIARSELFRGYDDEEQGQKTRNGITLSELFRQPEPTTQPAPQPEDSGSFWDSAIDFAEKWILPALPAANFVRSSAPALLGGTGAEIVGNVAKGLADNFPENSWRRNLLESINSGAQNIADTSLKIGSNKVEVGDNDTYRGSFGNAFESGAYNVAGGLASMLHADKSANALINAAQSLTDQTPIDPAFSLDYFISPHGLTRSFGQMLGSMASIAPTMFLVPEAAAARGVAALGGDALTNFLVNRGLFGVAKQFAKGAPNAFRYATTSPFVEGAAEGGFTRRDALEQGLSEEEATRRSINTMAANVPTLVASNFVEGLLLGAPFLRGGSTFQKALQGAARWQLNAAQQGIEEGTQRGIQDWQLGRPYSFNPFNYSPEQAQEAWEGYFGTLPMGVAPAVSHVVSRPDTGVQNWERGSDEKISNKDFSTRANKVRRNLRTWTNRISDGQMSDGVFNSIVRNAQELGYSPEEIQFALALATAESNGRQDDISEAGAIGVMQLMPDTAASLGVDPHDQEQNIRGGLIYLKQQLDRYNGDWNLAAAAYNAGPGNVTDHVPQNGETEHYVARINRYLDKAPDYQAGAKLGNEGILYLGENGAGEGKTWIRNPNMNVSTEGMRPESLNALDMLAKWFYDRTGTPLILNAGTNGRHAEGEYSHAAGWKFDIIDQLDGDGALFTADYRAQPLLKEFIAYGRSLGLGMNLEAEGTSNVHLDVAVDGTQWDGNGDHAGGFNPRGAKNTSQESSARGNSYDNNFSPRQNEIWQWAQYASQRLRDEYKIRLAPELIYRQWALEDGGDFTHSSRNWGGLKDTSGNFRTFASDKEYADAYVDDFMKLRPEINDVTDENGMASDKDFTDVMLKTGYITQGDYNNYINGLPNIKAPNAGRATSMGAPSSQTSQQTKPLFDLNAEDDATQKLFEQFAEERRRSSQDATEVDFFDGMFTDKGKFQNTPENRDAIRQNYSNEFSAWAIAQLQQNQQQAQPTQPATAQAQKGDEYLNNAPIIETADKFLAQLRTKGNDNRTLLELQEARNSGDIAKIENILKQHNVPISSPQNQQTAQPVQSNTTPQNILPSQTQTAQTQTQRTVKPWNPPRISHTEAQLQNQQAQQIQQQQIQSQEPTVQQATQAQTQPSQSTLQNQEQTLQPQEQVTTPQSTAQQQSTLQNQQQTLQSQSAQSQPTTTQPQPTISSKIRGHDGKQAKVVTQSKTKHNVRYRVVESGDLIASGELTNQGVFNNDEYSNRGGIQPRDRTTQELQADLYSQANNIDPDLALDSGLSVNSGAPVVRNDGVVFNGNGRVMALTYAYKNGKADAYKQALIERADEFGLNADDIAQMNSPVLVRELTNDVTQEELNDIAGTTAGGAASVADEQAFKDAKKITPETLQLFPKTEIDEKVDLTAAKFDDFVAAVLHDIATSDEMPALSKNGKLTKAGLDRVQRALFALAYGDPKLVETVSTSTDDTARNVTAALTNAAIEFAKVRADIESGDIANYDLSAITDAVNKLAALRKQNKPVKDYLNEIKLGEQDSEEMRQILSALDKFKRSQPKLTQFLKGLARRMREQGSTADTLFGTAEPAALLDLINQSQNAVASNNETDLFAQQEEQSNATSQTPQTEKSSGTEEDSVQDAQSRQTQAQEVAEPETQAKPSTKTPAREESDTNESIKAMQAALRESSEKIINDAAKNPDVARALEQLGAKIKNGKVTYPDDETFQQCVKLVNSGIVKSSQEGNTNTTIENFVDVKDLNPLQRAYAAFAKEMGVPIVFFRGNKNFHGAHANGISYYNVDATFSPEFVYWHEFGHWLKNNQPQLFQEMLDAADITKAQLDEKRNSRPELTDDELREEIICDAMSDVARRTGLLNQIGKKNSSLIQRIISWAKTTLDRFTDWFNRKELGLTNAQRDRMKDVFGKGVRQITDGNGNKIFRYNNRTHEIELVDGRKLPSIATKHSDNQGAFKFDERPQIKFSRDDSQERIQAQENSGTTQVSGTKTMYVKALQHLRGLKNDIKNVLDYGAGLGLGTDAMRENNPDLRIDSHEPNPQRWQGKTPPTFTDNTKIQSQYDAILNTNVLNVVEPEIRTAIVRDIGSLLKVGGKAMITTRSWKGDIEKTKNYTLGEEPHSVWIPKNVGGKTVRVYQKGFDGNELVDYVSETLGEDFKVEKVNGFGKSGVIVTRLANTVDKTPETKKAATEDSKPKYSLDAETKKSTVTVTGNEFGEYTDIKDLRKKAKDFYKNVLRGTSVRNPILGEVELTDDIVMFTNIGLNKMGSTSAQYEKLLLVKHLPELIESADRVSAEENYKNKRNASQYSYLHSTALVNGKVRDVNITIFTDTNGNRYYNHNLQSGTKTSEGLPVHLAQAPQTKDGIPTIGKPSNKNISQEERDSKPKYSLDASDNGNESFLQRVRNKISSLFDNSSPSTRRDKKITKLLSKLSGYRIAFGHLAKDDINVDDFQKIIRSRHAYEWEKLLPAVGEKIAHNLKLNATPEMANYIADWILTGAPNNTSAEATEFAKAMRDNPAMFELLDAVRDTFKEISDMTPLDRIKSKIVSEQKKTFLQRLGFKGGLREEFVDDLRPIENMVERAINESTPEVAKLIKQMIDPYKAARLLRGKGGVADVMLYGTAKDLPKIRAALQEQYPNVKFEYLKTMEMIIAEAGGVKNLADFEAFCLAKQTKEIHEHNRKNPTKKITTTFSEEDCDAVIQAGESKFGEAQQDLVRFSKTLLTMMYDSGLLTQTQYGKIIKGWKAYVPMARVFDENEDYDFSDSLQERKGSKRDIYSPIQRVIANTERFIRQAECNKAKLEIATLARCGGLGGIIAEVDTSKPDVDNIIYFKEGGKLKQLETPDVSIARAVNSLQKPSDAVWITKAFKSIMGFLRAAYTASNPDFAVGNIFRDSADAFIHNRYSGANPLTSFLDVWRKGLLGVIRRDNDYYDWIVNGGSQTSFVSEDVDYSQRAISDLTRGTRKERYLSKHFFSQVLDDIQKLAEYSEYATRLNTYKTAKDKLAAQRGAKATVTDKRLAALESREASIDFAKAGRSMRVVNKVLLFSNAAVQGLALIGKTFNPNKFNTAQGRKELFAASFRLLMASVVPTALMFAFNHTDDDRRKKYQNRPDWEKDTYWIFGDGFRIPKGMDLGIKLFSTLTDEFLGRIVDDDPIEAKRIAKTIRDAAPSITATIITPAFEAYANYSIFRDAPIVPFREQKLPAHMQFGAGTSPVAKKVGELIDYSPRKIDYLISGYLGFMGRFFSGGTDELPMVRRFIFDPYKNPKIVKEYYEALDEQTKLFNEYKQTKKAPDGYDKILHSRLKNAQETMRKFSKQERAILEDPKLSADQRTTKLHELEQRRVALCEKVFQRAR